MSYLDRCEGFIRRASGWFEGVGLAGLLLMMVITCVDVVGAKGFLTPVPGSIDVVVLAQLIAVSFAAATSLILGRHVQVEFFVLLLPERVRAVIQVVVDLLVLCFFALVVWRLLALGYYHQIGGEVSATVRIPLYPFAYAIAFSCVMVCIVYLFHFIRSALRVVKR